MSARLLFIVGAVLLVSFVPLAHATLYEYIDDKGVPTVTDNPALVPEKFKNNTRSITDKVIPPPDEAYLARMKALEELPEIVVKQSPPPSPRVAPSPAPTPKLAKAPASPKKVEVYIKSWCPYCKQALELLKSRGISYASYDVETDSNAYGRYKALGGSGVPVIVVDSQVIHGYSADSLLAALNS